MTVEPTKRRYRAIVRKTSHGCVARITEFPDLVVKDVDMLRCAERAEHLLQARIAALGARELPIPLPSDEAPPVGSDIVLFALDVSVPYEPKTVRIDLDPKLASRIDKVSCNRAAFFIEAAEHYLAETEARSNTARNTRTESSARAVGEAIKIAQTVQ
ncbi:hypothetical protein H8M03_11495 [Sphingomonas sabuli]|uniref:HicB-like antitoxin of toxin-antitoxin system domain-containing protein n=1 Tax=Sphingomonas sabuli TaxID=2764186 RepID=A0A7G9L1V9_9SPHN|nr:hypothetical protein [Sphingomonas sabuli]QNM82608.1 hypothetical protein H8M03_11495 [Sphingomonas sabuli]